MNKKKTKVKFIILLILVGLLLFVAAFASHLVPYDPYEQDLANALAKPNAAHLFGTDRYGRDMLSRVILGAQTTVFSSLFLVLVITVVGTIVGMLCGYFGGKLDDLLMRISDVFLGLGATPPIAEWGSMMSNGRSMLQTCPWIILAPGAAIFITVALFNLLGDTVRDMI